MPEIPWVEPPQQTPEALEVPVPPTEAATQPADTQEQPPRTVDRAKLEAIRKRIENATTPEEREKLREEMRKQFGSRPRRPRGQGNRGAGGGGSPGGGQ